MPGYRQLLTLIRQGKSADRIVEEMGVAPYYIRRMLGGRRFREQLELEAELATVTAAHRVASGVTEMARKLHELSDSKNAETARKTCLALLSEALRSRETTGRPEDRPPRDPTQVLIAAAQKRLLAAAPGEEDETGGASLPPGDDETADDADVPTDADYGAEASDAE